MDEEDIFSSRAVSELIAETILQAYKERFPRFDKRDRCIIVNSLLLTLATYLKALGKDEREVMIEMLIRVLRSLEDNW